MIRVKHQIVNEKMKKDETGVKKGRIKKSRKQFSHETKSYLRHCHRRLFLQQFFYFPIQAGPQLQSLSTFEI